MYIVISLIISIYYFLCLVLAILCLSGVIFVKANIPIDSMTHINMGFSKHDENMAEEGKRCNIDVQMAHLEAKSVRWKLIFNLLIMFCVKTIKNMIKKSLALGLR